MRASVFLACLDVMFVRSLVVDANTGPGAVGLPAGHAPLPMADQQSLLASCLSLVPTKCRRQSESGSHPLWYPLTICIVSQ